MGFNIGQRLIDEFYAKQPPNRGICKTFRETVETISKEAFKMFLGITCDVQAFSNNPKKFSLIINQNPLSDFVVLPPQYQNTLWYSNLLCGVIRGALDMINMKVNCYFDKDTLKGDQTNEIILELKEIVKDKYEEDD